MASRTRTRTDRGVPWAAGALCVLALALGPGAGWLCAEDLVPGSAGPQTDLLGVTWTPDEMGRLAVPIGWALSGTQFNQATLAVQQQRMRRDGGELVLDGTAGDLGVQRRIAFDPRRGGVRVVDVLTNDTPRGRTAQVVYWSNMSHGFTRVGLGSGATASGELPEGQVGAIAFVGSTPPTALVFALCDGRGGLRPTLLPHGNQHLQIGYTVAIPARGQVALAVGLRLLSGPSGAAQAPRELETYDGPEWLADLPAPIRRSLANFGGRALAGPHALPDLAALLEVAPGDQDQLAFASETLVPGTARCETVSVTTDFGQAEIPFAQVAAIVGGQHPSRRPAVFLRDGQRLVGEVACRGLAFELTSGLTVDLDVARMDRLVLKKGAPDAAPVGPHAWIVQTEDGQRLRCAPKASGLRALTRWGTLTLQLDQVLSLTGAEEEAFGLLAALEDGSRFRLLLGAERLAFDTALFGAVELDPWRVSAIVRDRGAPDEERSFWGPRRARPQAEVAGGDLFVGRLDSEVIHFVQAGSAIPQPPAQIRRLSNLLGGLPPEPGEALRFEASLWGGGRVGGELRELVLPFRTAYGVLEIPVRDLVEVRAPAPLLPEAVRVRVQRLVVALDDPDWDRREAATSELMELVELARPMLEDALDAGPTPEAERRLRRVLEVR